MLSDFLLQTLHRELLEDTISALPGNNKEEIVKKIKVLVARTVSRASSKTWKKSLNLVTPTLKKMTTMSKEITFDEDSNERFLSMMHTEDKVRVKLTAAVSKVVEPVLIDVATNVCAPLLSTIVLPISQAFLESINGFNNDMQQFLIDNSESLNDEKKLLIELDCAHRRVNHLSGSFMTSRQILWDMYTTNCSNLLNSSNDSGLCAYDLYCEISDAIRKLVHNAIHHFGVLILKSVPENDSAQGVLSEVCLMMRAGAYYLPDTTVLLFDFIDNLLLLFSDDAIRCQNFSKKRSWSVVEQVPEMYK